MITNSRYPTVYADENWITPHIASSGSTARLITFDAAENTTTSSRTGYIYLEYDNSDATGSIKIILDGKTSTVEYVFEFDPVYENDKPIQYYAYGAPVDSDFDYYLFSYKTENNTDTDVDYTLTSGSMPDINTTTSTISGSATYTQNESGKTLTYEWELQSARELRVRIYCDYIKNDMGMSANDNHFRIAIKSQNYCGNINECNNGAYYTDMDITYTIKYEDARTETETQSTIAVASSNEPTYNHSISGIKHGVNIKSVTVDSVVITDVVIGEKDGLYYYLNDCLITLITLELN